MTKQSILSKHNLPYIFIIGFNKCATRSFHQFFLKNNFTSIHWDNGKIATSIINNSLNNLKVLDGYDKTYQVFSDMMFLNHKILIEGNSFFRSMDKDYPDSLFIYNTRNIDNWIQSRLNHTNGQYTFLERYKSVYSLVSIDHVIKKWKETRLNFEDELDKYFRKKTNLVVIDIDKEINPPLKISKLLNIEFISDEWEHVGKTQI